MNFISRFLWLILTIAAISLAMVFAVSNTQQVTLQFWPFTGQLEIAAWVLVIGAMATGALFGGGSRLRRLAEPAPRLELVTQAIRLGCVCSTSPGRPLTSRDHDHN